MKGLRGRFCLSLGAFSLDAAFEVHDRGICALFGPSGSGKTTLLRCVAGLEREARGYLEVDGALWQDDEKSLFVPPHRRSLGYVFQTSALFPHLSVRGNLEYGFKRTPAARRRIDFAQVVNLLGLTRLLDRRPARLSGGERQRVAIARALLRSPNLLLLDEPLASLDAASRRDILPYLERLHDDSPIPVVYVTHNLDEVCRLADHLLLMRAGRITAGGPLADTLARCDSLVAAEGEAAVVVETRVGDHDDAFGLTRLEFAGGSLLVSRQPFPAGHRVRVRVMARDVSLALRPPEQTSIQNIISTVVVDLQVAPPAHVMVRLDAGGAPLLSLITRRSAEQLGLRPGQPVHALVKSASLIA